MSTFMSKFNRFNHPMRVFRPAWNGVNRMAANDLHGVRNPDGTGVKVDYFAKSKGLWYGWK